MIFASSYLIYDPKLYLSPLSPKQPVILKEGSPIYPRNLCGGAKLFHELELQFLDDFLGNRVSCNAIRIFRVYGYHSRDIISRWIRSALRSEPITLYNAEGIFDYIFADDVAEGLLKIAKTHYRGVINLGTGKARAIEDVVTLFKAVFP